MVRLREIVFRDDWPNNARDARSVIDEISKDCDRRIRCGGYSLVGVILDKLPIFGRALLLNYRIRYFWKTLVKSCANSFVDILVRNLDVVEINVDQRLGF